MVRSIAALAFATSLSFGAAAAAEDNPHNDYMLHCQGCHGPDGSGAPGGIPSFRGYVAKFLTVPGGREYLIRVPGTSQSELSDRRVASVLNWMIETFDGADLPPSFQRYDEAEVARTRRPPLIEVTAERARLVRLIEANALQ